MTEEILSKHKQQKDSLMQILHEIQDSHPQQYLPEEDLLKVAKYLNISMSSVYGVVTYYSMFSVKPRGRYIIRLCQSPVCDMLGFQVIADKLKSLLQINFNETTSDGLFTLENSECLGLCGNKPSMMINKEVYTGLNTDVIELIINNIRNESK
jgi:NADH-quinone oxidoreductase subunit E